MRQVRNNIFETNSSSTHSISLNVKDVNEIISDNITVPFYFETILQSPFTNTLGERIGLCLMSLFRAYMQVPTAYNDFYNDGEIEINDYENKTQKLDKRWKDDYTRALIEAWNVFIESPLYEDVIFYIKSKMKIDFDLDKQYSQMDVDSVEPYVLSITGLDKIAQFLEVNDDTCNSKKLEKFINGDINLVVDAEVEVYENY